MAGKKVYMGEIMQSMVDTLEAHTTALANINNGVAQSVSMLNVEAGDTIVYPITTVDKTTTSTLAAVGSVKAICAGSVRLKGRIKITSGTAQMGYNINGGAVTYFGGTTSATYVDAIKDLALNLNDVLIIYFTSSAGGTTTLEAGASFSYNLKDIVNNGAFAKIS